MKLCVPGVVGAVVVGELVVGELVVGAWVVGAGVASVPIKHSRQSIVQNPKSK